MNRFPIAMLVAAGALAAGCVVRTNDTSDSTLTISNESGYDIEELYITLHHSSSWGQNLLGGPLFPGDVIILDDIACDTYDVLMIDETYAQCEIDAISLCFDDADWVIRNNACDAFSAQ